MSKIDESSSGTPALPGSVLVFTLHTSGKPGPEHYGVDVFQVREVLESPTVTHIPGMAWAVKGMISLRGQFIPVIDLAMLLGSAAEGAQRIMLVADVGEAVMAFLVDAVDTIVPLPGLSVSQPPQILATGYLDAIARSRQDELIQIVNLTRLVESKLGPKE